MLDRPLRKDFLPFPRRPRELYSSSSASSTVAARRCDTAPVGGAASEPVGCGAASTGADAGAGAGAGSAGTAASGWGVAVPEMAFLDFEVLPLGGAPAARAASLAAFFSFLARFLLRMSSGVWVGLDGVVKGEKCEWRKMKGKMMKRKKCSYLLPCPYGTERVKEAHVLEQVGI